MGAVAAPFVLGVLSRNRPDWVRRCVASAIALGGDNLQVVVAFDDDYTGFDMLPDFPNTVKALLSPRLYYCAAMNELYDHMKEQAQAHGFPLDYFAVVNDDCEFMTARWPEALRRVLDERFPDGEGIAEFVGLDKCAHFGTRASFIDREFGGKLAAPGYIAYCSDTELMFRAKALGRYAFVEAANRINRVALHYEVWDSIRHECRRWYLQDRALFDSRFPK